MSAIEVLCNREMTALLPPIRQSRPVVDTYRFEYIVAEYDEDALRRVTEEQCREVGAYWRHTDGLTVEVPLDEAAIRKAGLIGHIWEHGVTTERHVAGAVADLAREAGKTQVEFMDWAAEFVPPTIAEREAEIDRLLAGTALGAVSVPGQEG